MKKKELIERIIKFNPHLIWEIDEEAFYPYIGWRESVDHTYWFENNLLLASKNTLTILLKRLIEEA